MQITTALKRARRSDLDGKAAVIQAALWDEHRGQPQVVATAYAVAIRAQVAIPTTLREQIKNLKGRGLGMILGARVHAEFGDDPNATSRPRHVRTMPVPARSSASRAKEDRTGPPRSPGPAHRRAERPGVRLAQCASRCAGLPRPAPRPRRRPCRCIAAVDQPTRGNPAQLSVLSNALRRDDRLVVSLTSPRSLTLNRMGCLSVPGRMLMRPGTVESH